MYPDIWKIASKDLFALHLYGVCEILMKSKAFLQSLKKESEDLQIIAEIELGRKSWNEMLSYPKQKEEVL